MKGVYSLVNSSFLEHKMLDHGTLGDVWMEEVGVGGVEKKWLLMHPLVRPSEITRPSDSRWFTLVSDRRMSYQLCQCRYTVVLSSIRTPSWDDSAMFGKSFLSALRKLLSRIEQRKLRALHLLPEDHRTVERCRCSIRFGTPIPLWYRGFVRERKL